tara:strand:- start:2089 stop:3246 length:1158 start_codon:yes stop_codon:yes gene_type:complete
MAVSIDTVYQRVLALANKEQRGYITPLEYNLLANQAQMEIFEQYFYDINLYNRAPSNSTEFSDHLHILEEKIAPFRVNNASLLASTSKFEDTFEIDITGWIAVNGGNGTVTHVAPAAANSYDGGIKILQNANGAAIYAESATFSLVADKKYVVKYALIDMLEPATYSILIEDGAASSHQFTVYEPAVGSFEFTFIAETTGVHNIQIRNLDTGNDSEYITIGNISITEFDNTTLPADLYRLGEVLYKGSGEEYPTTVAEVNPNEVTKYNLSPLARPTTSNPAYVRSGANSIGVYPTALGVGSEVTCNYVKRPTDVYWGYVITPNSSGGNEYPMYNAAATVDFTLHDSEEMPLVYKILELAGIVINKPGLVQVASLEQQENLQNEKQ